MSKERYYGIIDNFRKFLKDKDNKPHKNETYGNKEEGKIRFEHFIIYAILRGRDISKTTHSIDSDKYKDILIYLEFMSNGGKNIPKYLMEPFGFTQDEYLDVISKAFK
jgi:hypothetical protein